jgi:SAM-dependent methyltransferase
MVGLLEVASRGAKSGAACDGEVGFGLEVGGEPGIKRRVRRERRWQCAKTGSSKTVDRRYAWQMGVTQVAIERCVACGSGRWVDDEEWLGYKLATCLECRMTFTLNPDYSTERYVAIYGDMQGGEALVPADQARVYHAPERRLMLEGRAPLAPRPRLTPAEAMAFAWLKSEAPRQSCIVDCGCGSGRFLNVLRRASFRAVGIELSETIVELLKGRGFDARVGKAPDFPWASPDPYAITFFEVLEHLPDPGPVMAHLRERFPESRILASVPSPRRASLLSTGKRSTVDYPPNHFLRWTPEALGAFFRRLGYSDVQVQSPPPVGSELMPGFAQLLSYVGRAKPKAAAVEVPDQAGPRVVPPSVATVLLLGHRLYQAGMDVAGMPMATYWRLKGGTAASMLAIASP